ncbi:MAG: sigma-B regulation protein RsbU (phosphoserine phosphatase) [Pirellulaceae bacterium]|jgi:sigma-B regulation protein RsbU (phosphoserine phosphatase)
MAELKIVHGPEEGTEFELDRTEYVLGRHPDCPLAEMFGDDALVSRRHAKITAIDDQFFVEDTGSRNGTFVNGKRLKRKTRLIHEDHIFIGGREFIFINPAATVWDRIRNSPSAMEEVPIEFAADSRIVSSIRLKSPSGSCDLDDNSPERKLDAILQLLSKMGHTLDRSQILEDLLDGLFQVFPKADRGFVGIKPAEDDEVTPVASRFRHADSLRQLSLSRTIISYVMENREAVLSTNAAQDARFEDSASVKRKAIRSMMCSPLIDASDRVLGVVQLDTSGSSVFEQHDLEIMSSIAPQVAMALSYSMLFDDALAQQALQRDLELARRVQLGLLPSSAPEVANCVFYDFYDAANDVGGDYYDYIPLPGDRLAVVMADASGKGVSAALLMTKVSSELKFALSIEDDARAAIERVNRSLCEARLAGRFVTMVVAVIDLKTRKVSLVNAGHTDPLLRRADGTVVTVGSEERGMAIGIIEDRKYVSYQFALEVGDCLALFTDGFNEAENSDGDLFGMQRIKQCLISESGDARRVGELIVQDVKSFLKDHPQRDDMCMLCFSYEDIRDTEF